MHVLRVETLIRAPVARCSRRDLGVLGNLGGLGEKFTRVVARRGRLTAKAGGFKLLGSVETL